MGCASCGTNTKDGKPKGCRGNGGCTGGCNRMNVFDWLSDVPFAAENERFNVVEITFRNGARKGFYRNTKNLDCITGDYVVVESNAGFDIGKVSLSGELVRLQMRKKRISEDAHLKQIIRLPNEYDIERWENVKTQEYSTMIMARVIARNLELKMKIGDVEYQGDGRKATFYYTADDRVDFRELIKLFAKEFRVKIEMRQIGARQEAARIGGIGSCGRELCCSTWLSEFKSVSTAAARYQNLSINQSKLSGQCGRLKCCLNYELDTYLDALADFPKNADYLQTDHGKARLIKTDIFKRILYYVPQDKNVSVPLSVERVKEIIAMNKAGEKPASLKDMSRILANIEPTIGFQDGVGQLELETLDKMTRKRKAREKRKRRRKRKKEDGQKTDGVTKSSNSEAKTTNNNSNKAGRNTVKKVLHVKRKPKTDDNQTNKEGNNSNKKTRKPSSNRRRKPRNNNNSDKKE